LVVPLAVIGQYAAGTKAFGRGWCSEGTVTQRMRNNGPDELGTGQSTTERRPGKVGSRTR
jgi:hypothetical protein